MLTIAVGVAVYLWGKNGIFARVSWVILFIALFFDFTLINNLIIQYFRIKTLRKLEQR